jgi:arginine N-succinyltransferase
MDMSYLEADLLSKRNKEFIKSLFPTGDIYASLLPKEAQAVIGKVGRETKGVEKMLRRVGFQYCNRIDPFDGGPHFRATTDEIALVRRSARVTVSAVEDKVLAPKVLVAVERREAPFIECAGVPARVEKDGVVIDRDTAELLRIAEGSAVAVLPLD